MTITTSSPIDQALLSFVITSDLSIRPQSKPLPLIKCLNIIKLTKTIAFFDYGQNQFLEQFCFWFFFHIIRFARHSAFPQDQYWNDRKLLSGIRVRLAHNHGRHPVIPKDFRPAVIYWLRHFYAWPRPFVSDLTAFVNMDSTWCSFFFYFCKFSVLTKRYLKVFDPVLVNRGCEILR